MQNFTSQENAKEEPDTIFFTHQNGKNEVET